jgi:N6-adenosine-specific RNA methylase IME4
MTVAEICAFPLPPLETDALLFLWRVASMQSEALQVVRAWGFVPKSEIVWVKKTRHGKRHIGMGRYVRAEHESCIIASRGRGNTLIRDKAVRSVFEAKAGRHSEKPQEFYGIVERMAEGPYCELFSRQLREGWTSYGDELQHAAPERSRPVSGRLGTRLL